MNNLVTSIIKQIRLYHVHRQLVLLTGELEYQKNRFNSLGDSQRDEVQKQYIHRRIPLLESQIEDYQESFSKLKGRAFW